MTAREFCYWLQGCFELNPPASEFNNRQTELIQKHLTLVFAHEIDPSAGPPPVQQKLNDIHSPPWSKPSAPGEPTVRC
jgi:hypothetical protein